MKKLTAKYLSLLMLASLLGGNAQASHDGYVNAGYANGSDCCRPQYECGCNPLYCGAWDLQIHGGVAPILWRNRGDVLGISCATSSTTPLIALFQLPKFNKLFKLPWIVGGQVGFHWSDNTRVYVEFNYSQAKAKTNVAIVSTGIAALNTLLSPNKYKVFDAYVGARYYWDRWCDRVSFFLGGKVGITHHKRVSTNLNATLGQLNSTFDFEAFGSNTVVAGGGNIGLDYCICGNWSLVLTGEVVASCGPRAARHHVVTPTIGLTDLIVGSADTELRFPVTLAVRYSF